MSYFDDDDDSILYILVVNEEEQYSTWPADRELPLGWEKVGEAGTKKELEARIEEIWSERRPIQDPDRKRKE